MRPLLLRRPYWPILYLSYEEDPDYVRFVYEELQRAATLGAYDEALRRFLKAGMLLGLKGKKRNDFISQLLFAPYLV